MKNNDSLVIGGVVAVFVTFIVSATAIGIAVEDGARVESLLGIIVPQVTSALGILVLLAKVAHLGDKVAGVDDKVDNVAGDTKELTNGLLDAKIRAGVAEVLAPHLVDPDVSEQLERDRTRVDAKNAATDTVT